MIRKLLSKIWEELSIKCVICAFSEKCSVNCHYYQVLQHEYKKTAGPLLWSAAVSELRSQIDEE
jgi:hypothetical protein